MKSGYFIGSLLLAIPYIGIFLKRPDLRREMLIIGFLLLPFALISPFFIPEYWSPPYLFGYLLPFKFGIEDLMFMFIVGGLCSVIYEFIKHKKEVSVGKRKRRILWTPFVLCALIILTGEYFFPDKSILTLIATGIIVSLFMVFKRHDLMIQSLTAGLFFSLLYFLLFYIFKTIFPGYIAAFFTHNNLFGWYVYSIPIEEILFAFSAGACWSIAYEYMFSFKTK